MYSEIAYNFLVNVVQLLYYFVIMFIIVFVGVILDCNSFKNGLKIRINIFSLAVLLPGYRKKVGYLR